MDATLLCITCLLKFLQEWFFLLFDAIFTLGIWHLLAIPPRNKETDATVTHCIYGHSVSRASLHNPDLHLPLANSTQPSGFYSTFVLAFTASWPLLTSWPWPLSSPWVCAQGCRGWQRGISCRSLPAKKQHKAHMHVLPWVDRQISGCLPMRVKSSPTCSEMSTRHISPAELPLSCTCHFHGWLRFSNAIPNWLLQV